ncbi:alpha/beta hydrolase family protein [Plantactinospora sp. GCM10030261]|uniref:alpha/beta hydrolase family protein n=1 Tax=Plantactinospora sp. GCM10030261 TaxID=3273420 RepID=UPI00360AC170
MDMKIARVALSATLVAITLSGCGAAVSASTATPAAAVTAAPTRTFPVGVRTLTLDRGADRPLPTTIWYPAGSGRLGQPPVPALPMAPGRFPLVLFSHGLHSLPEYHVHMASRWAAAGFVVAAPAYPRTNRRTKHFSRADVRNQPADARLVIQRIGVLDTRPGDLFAGHLAMDRIAAAGHSAGGYTTAGLFGPDHSARFRAGVIISGGGMSGSSFGGPPAALLYVHGDKDPTVPLRRGRAAFDRTPWPKAFLTLAGQNHGAFLAPGRTGFTETMAATTDFLRWRLYGDEAARERLVASVSRSGRTTLETRL